MQAVLKTDPGPGHVVLADVPEPSPEPHQVKLEVEACGICGTDLHVRAGTFRSFPPVILGHEFVGRVVEEGDAVRGTTQPDTPYAVLGAIAVVCGQCRYCRSGQFMFCPTRRGMGHGVNGAFTRYVTVRPDQLFALPEGVPSLEGALVEPFAVAVAAVAENSPVRAGDTALVTGPGPIGLLCVLVLAHLGIRTIVVGVDQDAQRLAIARELGAAHTINASTESVDEVLAELTDGRGIDVAYEASGAAPAAGTALRSLRPLGAYTQIGHFGREISAPFDLVAFKQLRVQGTVGYNRGTWDRALRLLADGVRPSRVVTHHFPLSEWQTGFDLFARGDALKVILHPTTVSA